MTDVQVTSRTNIGGGRVARVDVPIGAAIKLAEQKFLTLGWGRCRIKLLEKKSLICYKCQGSNHVAASCLAAEAPRKCYKCGIQGHIARECLGVARNTVPAQEKESNDSGKQTPQ